MRNFSIHVLAPGATIVLTINPPISADERPYVATIRGRESVVVRPIDTTHVAITNTTKRLTPFSFFIATSRLPLPPALGGL